MERERERERLEGQAPSSFVGLVLSLGVLAHPPCDRGHEALVAGLPVNEDPRDQLAEKGPRNGDPHDRHAVPRVHPSRSPRALLPPPASAFGNSGTDTPRLVSIDLLVFFQFDFQFFDLIFPRFPTKIFFSVKSSRQKTLFFDSQGGDRGVRSRRWARREQAIPKLKEARLRSAALEVVIARGSEAPRRATEAWGKPREEKNSRAGSLRHSLRFPRTRVGVGAAWKT